MGKTKQTKEKKFDRNVEISAPILDPEIIKAIHSPPKGQRLDIRHGGFKALLSDLNSQDSTDEVTPISESHVPSYIGISCAVSGYSNYSSYNKRQFDDEDPNNIRSRSITKSKLPTNTQTHPGAAIRHEPHQVNHIKIDKSTVSSAGEELKELTEKLTASVAEKHRSPSPITPTEDDRHHGAYVGARYCPMPPPSKLVHKHIPLLGIDDEQDPDTVVIEENKVENKIASLYGDSFVEDWRESISHKAKKELVDEQQEASQSPVKSPKDLVTLKPTPKEPVKVDSKQEVVVDVPVPNCEVLKGVERQFLNKLLTDENPPMPKSPSPQPMSPVSTASSRGTVRVETPQHDIKTTISSSNIDQPHEEILNLSEHATPTQSPGQELSSTESDLLMTQDVSNRTVLQSPEEKGEVVNAESPVEQEELESHEDSKPPAEQKEVEHEEELARLDSPINEPYREEASSVSPVEPADASLDSIIERNIEKHIEGEIRAQSPLDNESSPVRFFNSPPAADENLVSFSPEPSQSVAADDTLRSGQPQKSVESLVENNDQIAITGRETSLVDESHNNNNDESNIVEVSEKLSEGPVAVAEKVADKPVEAESSESKTNQDGHYFLRLLDEERAFIEEQVKRAENVLAEKEGPESDEETLGRIRSAIGKANLLINKKCNQFRELCERSINEDAGQQFAVHNDDLAGFWDMLSIQFIDVRNSFKLI